MNHLRAQLALVVALPCAAVALFALPALAQDGVIESSTNELLKYGLAGVVMIAEAIVIRFLFLRLESKDAQLYTQAVENTKLLERVTTQLARLNINGTMP